MDPYRAVKGAVLILVYCLGYINGEIRCYCNEAKCVTSSYMCKSQLGMCYSHVKINDGIKTIVSGCADSLQEEPGWSTCAGKGIEDTNAEVTVNETDVVEEGNGVELKETTVVETIKQTSGDVNTNSVDVQEEGLTCCTQDMCNYRDSNEITITITDVKETKGPAVDRTENGTRPQKDLWFKAAVIAVPIAGGFILILLVLLAVRMLRTDSRHHKRLIQIRRERSLTKAQLYVTDHFIDKDKTNTSIVQQKDTSSTSNHSNHSSIVKNNTTVHHSHSKRDHSHNHSHRSSNTSCPSCCRYQHHHKQCHPQKVTTHRDGHVYEQIVSQTSDVNNSSPCEHACSRASPYPSVIVWGKTNSTDGTDVV